MYVYYLKYIPKGQTKEITKKFDSYFKCRNYFLKNKPKIKQFKILKQYYLIGGYFE